VFERFTVEARQALFFARDEACNYGSPYIETEHLLLGVFKEDRTLANFCPPGSNVEPELRAEIEKAISPRERISGAVEVPLSPDCKKALMLAAETSERLGHRVIEPRHLLIGILRVRESLAARILSGKGLKPEALVGQIEEPPNPKRQSENESNALLTLKGFLSGLKTQNWQELMSFFAANAQFIDASGKRWNRDELARGFDALFAPYAKKNASYVVEATQSEARDVFVATVRWKNALLASEQRAWMHRMTLVLLLRADIYWEILTLQVIPVNLSEVSEQN
jgi:hypothetical protein